MCKTNSLFPIFICLCSCHQDLVKQYQREGRSLIITEEEFEQQLAKLNLTFNRVDSSIVKSVNIDTLEIAKDTILFRYKFMAVRPTGEEFDLNAPVEPIFEYLGKKLPDFSLPNLEGELVRLSDYYGRPLVLNFWFRSCTPCKKEMPRLNEIKEKFEDKVSFVAICLDDLNELTGFFKYHDFDYNHLINGRQVANEIGILSYPKNIVINSKGEVSQILDSLLETIDDEGYVLPGEGAELIREIKKVL